MKKIPIIILLCFTQIFVISQTVIYVNQNAAGAQTGESWADAYLNLQDALSAAFSGNEIWVAEGVYKPTVSADRNSTFDLKSGVKMYGGFSGSETTLNQRNPELHPTSLSGEIGDPTTRTDNVYHVVRGKGLNGNTRIDGFIISGGYSFGEFFPMILEGIGAGMLLEGASWISDSRPQIWNCRFEGNAANMGGGLGITWNNPADAAAGNHRVNPVITDCRFENNKAAQKGGGIYKSGITGADTFLLVRCIITDNSAFGADGGGLCFAQSYDSKILMRQCTFERDTAFQGGGIYLPATAPSHNTTSLHIDSCSFIRNFALDGAGIYYDGYILIGLPIDSLNFSFTVKNSNFENNIVTNGDGAACLLRVYNSTNIVANIENSTFRNNISGYFVVQADVGLGSKADFLYQNCIFSNNISYGTASPCFGIHTSCGGGPNPATLNVGIYNCLFEKNGAGVICLSSPDSYANAEITNCTFYRNGDPQFTKSWWEPSSSQFYNNFRIENCIVWEPETDAYHMFYNNDAQNLTMWGFEVDNSLISLYTPGFLPGADEVFGDNVYFAQNPMFVDSAAGDFRLLPCSLAVNSGDNDKTEDAGLLTDLDGLPRIRYDTVDMGAYETQDSCIIDAIMHVNEAIGELEIWNNPSADGQMIYVSPVETGTKAVLKVYDSAGKLAIQRAVFDTGINRIDLKVIPKGSYSVVLKTESGVWVGRWVRL